MKCDIKLYGIHKRDENILKCKQQLGLSDQDIFYEDRPNGGMPFHMADKTWNSQMQDGITHRCVIQDDVELCDNFREHLDRIVTAQPNQVISLCQLDYKKKYDYIDNLTTPYVTMAHVIGGCSLVLPQKYIKPCFDWCKETFPDIENGNPHEDTAIALWAYRFGVPIITTIPCTVQHIGDVSSLFGTSVPIQRSAYFKKDCSDVAWENSSVSPQMPNVDIFQT